jgi:hypothetical protein
MAMNGDGLGQEIFDAVASADAPGDVKAQVLALWKKIGNVIVNHIVNNAEVPAGIAVSTTGTAAAQTGNTTGTGRVQ